MRNKKRQLSEKTTFQIRQELAARSGNEWYGDGGTIHSTTVLDVEVDPATKEVTTVWFRCLNLPFKIFSRNDPVRFNPNAEIHGVEIRHEDRI